MNEIEIVVDDSDFDVTASAESADSAVEIQVGAADGGTPGENGATFYPSVSADGMLSWTNDKNLPNPEPVNIKGTPGKDGTNGKDGYTPIKGVDYFDGKDGYTPVKGKDYFDGSPGYTPVRGKDYYTEADKTEMVNAVLAALPVYGGEVAEV